MIVSVAKGESPAVPSTASEIRQLTQNYRVLRFFLTAKPVSAPESGDTDPLLAEVATLRAAQARLQESRWDEALRLLQPLSVSRPFLQEKKRELYLRVLYGKKLYAQFVAAFVDLPELPQQLQLMRLTSLMRLNRRQEALPLFANLFAELPLAEVKTFLDPTDLTWLLGRLDAAFWTKKYTSLLATSAYSEFLRESSRSRLPQLAILFKAEFMTKFGRYQEAQVQLRQVRAESCLAQKERLLLRIDVRQDRTSDIEERLEKLRSVPQMYQDTLVDVAAYFLAQGDARQARAMFSRYLECAPQSETTYWRALWIVAWLHYRANEPQDALRLFQKGLHAPFFNTRMSSQYWRQRLEQMPFSDLLDYPYFYYTVKVYGRTGILNDRHLQYAQGLDGPTGVLFRQQVDDLKKLFRRQYVEECQALLRWTDDQAGLNSTERFLLRAVEAILLWRQNRYQKAYRTLSGSGDGQNPVHGRLPYFLSPIYFPAPYLDLVVKYSGLYNLDPLLIMAIIREESFFRTDAVSLASAYGLMQVLPETARRYTTRGKRRLKRSDLLKPEINIEVGIQYFKSLLDKYNGRLHLALAAYNAGDIRVDRWLAEFGHFGEDEFIEMIPFGDTRNYIKNILVDYFFYRFYYGRMKTPVS